MHDRRFYGRLILRVPVLIFKDDIDEMTCEVLDISEKGIGFQMTEHDFVRSGIVVGDIVSFQFMDCFCFGRKFETVMISSTMQVVHINHESGCYIIGGLVDSSEYSEYVVKRLAVSVLEKKERI